jgi:ABC-type multidrug transport system fused ATPase/permease subunit
MHLFDFLKDFVKSRPLTVASNLSFSFLVPIQDIVLPHFYGKLIDSLSSSKGLLKNITFVLALFTIIEIGFVFSDMHDIKAFSTFQTFTRQEILKNVMKKYEKNFTDLYLGTLMSKIVKIPYTLVVWYERVKYQIIPYILVFGFASCYFASHDKMLGTALFITAVGYAAIIAGVPQFFCKEYAIDKDKMINQIHEEIDDTLRNFISMHGDSERQQKEVERLEEYEALFTVKFAETMQCLLKTKVYTSITILAFTTFFILRSYHLLKNKKLTTAMFSSMFLILIYLSNSMMSLEGQLREMIFDWGIIAESDELFDKSPESSKSKNPKATCRDVDIPQKEGIGMKNVTFTFPGKGNVILKDITFHINKSDTVVLLGDIGSGKSTILKLLLRFNEPDSGCIYIDGKSYEDIPIKEIKKRMGYMYQNPYLFNRSVLENILYGTDGISRETVEEFIKSIGVDKEFANLEEGIDTKVGKNGSRLSGGQKQVVVALRVYFQDPDVVIMDEPTASLDGKTKALLKMLLNVILKDKTTIIVTHDEELLELANKQLYIQDGVVIEKNNPKTTEKNNSSFFMDGGLLDSK